MYILFQSVALQSAIIYIYI